MRPEDRQLLVEGFDRLSPESRYRRFFAAIPRLTSSQLDYLTQIDHSDHEALIAIDPATEQAVGVARYVRTGPGVAEPAVVVADDWQGRGVGSELLNQLVVRALDEGIERFEAPVLAANADAIHVLRRLGDTTIEHRGIESELTIELRRPPVDPEHPLRSLLRAVAEGVVDPALTFWHRSVPRPGAARGDLENVVLAGVEDAPPPPMAREIAMARGARLVLVAARHPLLDALAAPDVERLARPLRRDGLEVETAVRRGDLAAILLDLARETRARLIVVSDRGGDEDVAGRLLGSVWDHVSHHAPCDVLIAR